MRSLALYLTGPYLGLERPIRRDTNPPKLGKRHTLGGGRRRRGNDHFAALCIQRLPAPDRELRVRVHGGASALRITRPAGVPLRVLVAGGASKLVVDTLELGAVGDELRWEAPGWAKSASRLDVEVHGGADRLSITEK